MKRAMALVERDMRKFRRSPALLFASLVLPLVQLVILGNAFGGNIKNVILGVVNLDRGPESVGVLERVRAVGANARTFLPTDYDDQGAAIADLRKGALSGWPGGLGKTFDMLLGGSCVSSGAMKIPELRKAIDKLDARIVQLLNERTRQVLEIGAIKVKAGEAIYVPHRERMVLQRICKMNQGPMTEESLRAIYREIMSSALSLQKTMTIAYLGPEATFTHQAAIQKFGRPIPRSRFKVQSSRFKVQGSGFRVSPTLNRRTLSLEP